MMASRKKMGIKIASGNRAGEKGAGKKTAAAFGTP